MNTQQIIDNLKAQGIEYRIFYKNEYPAVMECIRVKIGDYWEPYNGDKHYLKTKQDWVVEFYGSCNAPPPRTDIDEYGHPADRVLMKVVEMLYELKKTQ